MTDDTQGPTIFEPDDEHRTLARNLGVDLDRELEAFRAFNRNREVRNPARAFTGWLRRAHANPQPNVVVGRPATPAKRDGYELPLPTPVTDPFGEVVNRWIDENPEQATDIRTELGRRADDAGRSGWTRNAWIEAELRALVLAQLRRAEDPNDVRFGYAPGEPYNGRRGIAS